MPCLEGDTVWPDSAFARTACCSCLLLSQGLSLTSLQLLSTSSQKPVCTYMQAGLQGRTWDLKQGSSVSPAPSQAAEQHGRPEPCPAPALTVSVGLEHGAFLQKKKKKNIKQTMSCVLSLSRTELDYLLPRRIVYCLYPTTFC